MPDQTLKDALAQLRAPFTPAALKFKIQVSPRDQGNGQWGKALVIAYMDSRLCAERLNHVAPGAWSDTYSSRDENSVVCRITVLGASHEDVGFGDVRDRGMTDRAIKSMYSDAFKRAAVKFGIGSFLYAMPQQFLDVAQLKQGRGAGGSVVWYLTPRATEVLRDGYAAWLRNPTTRKQFGEPIDHGDLPEPPTATGPIQVAEPVYVAPSPHDEPEPAPVDIHPESDKVRAVRAAYAAAGSPESFRDLLDRVGSIYQPDLAKRVAALDNNQARRLIRLLDDLPRPAAQQALPIEA